MALDEAILSAHAQGLAPPTMRFYTWQPPAVSLGRHQSAAEVLDEEACQRMGLDVVTRPTGGWAVLHDGDLCFSIVVSHRHLPTRGVIAAYRWLSQGIVRAMELLGLEAALIGNVGEPRGVAAGFSLRSSQPEGCGYKVHQRPRADLCFAAAAGSDIRVNGRKLIGSAQVHRSRVILQQNVIPLRQPNPEYAAAFRAPAARAALAQAAALSGLLGRDVEAEEVKAAILDGFAGALGAVFLPGRLLREEAWELVRLPPS
jgi:lipoate-protein ligase A